MTTTAKPNTMPTSKPFSARAFLEEYIQREKDKPPEARVGWIDLSPANQHYQNELKRMEDMVRARLGVPANLIYGGARNGGKSGRAMELAAQLQAREVRVADAGRIKGRSADWMVIDEAVPDVHPNCRCTTVPVGADSRNVATAHDDMLDALGMTFGLSRTEGEPDEDFRARVKAFYGSADHRATAQSLVQAAQQISGVEHVIINEQVQGTVVLHVCIDERLSASEVLDVRDRVMMAVDEVRPMGIKVEYHWDDTRDRPSQLSPEEIRRQEEELFIRRLRSKILERYPGDE